MLNPVVSLLLLSFLSIFGLLIFFWDSLTFSFYFFDIVSSLRSTKEVTTEKMSLNKWKAWHVENSKDVLKIGKKLVTTKRGSRDQFLAKIKFFEPGCFTFAPLFFVLFWSTDIFFRFFDFFLLFLWYFYSLRTTKEVTIENMSLNKWKAWTVENSEDVLKIDKKLVTRKRGSRDQFLAKIKFIKTRFFHFCSSLFCLFLGCRYF